MTKLNVQRLLAWFRANKRDLPWRRTGDVYRIWVSEVMLQQTQVSTVVPYYHRFLRRFPDARRLAAASEQEVLKAWEGLGYYARARHLHQAAQVVVRRNNGRIPRDPEAFGALPGVGPYIRAAVMSIACGHALPVVDGNVLRVISRRLGIRQHIRKRAVQSRIETYLRSQIPARKPGEFNEALMELGATVCAPRSPSCGPCPLRAACVARRLGLQESLPRKSRGKPVPIVRASVAVLAKGGRVFIQQRPSRGLLGGLWEFPGGRIRAGETPRQALRRECREELGVEVEVTGKLGVIEHSYSHFRIILHVFLCRVRSGLPRSPLPHRWIRSKDLDRHPFPAANRKFFPELRQAIIGTGSTRLRPMLNRVKREHGGMSLSEYRASRGLRPGFSNAKCAG